MSSIKALCERRGQLEQQARAINDKVESEDRAWTAEEKAKFERIHLEDCQLRERIQQQEKIGKLKSELDRPVGSGRLPGSLVASDVNGNDMPQESYRSGFGPLMFRDSNGEKIRALAPHERLSGPMGRQREEDDDAEQGPVDVGRIVASRLTGDLDGLTEREYKMLGSSDGSGGTLFAPTVASQVLDLARSASVCIKAGTQTLPLTGAEHVVVTLASDATATWRHPGATIPSADMTFGKVVFRPRTLGVVIPVQIETIEDAPNLSAVVEMALSASMGLAVDQAVLGTGSVDPARPIGLLATTGTNAIASVGTPTDFSKLVSATSSILSANYPGDLSELSWISHPRDGKTFANLQDTLHQPLRKPDWVGALQELHTTSFSTTGGGGTESSMVVGHFPMAVLGVRKSFTLRILESGYITDSSGVTFEAGAALQKLIVAYLRVDVAFLRPTWFTILQNVTP